MKKDFTRLRRKLLRPAVLRKIVTRAAAEPRAAAPAGNGPAEVYRLSKVSEPAEIFKRFESAWERSYSKLFSPEQTILIKVNLNTPDAYPASTDPEMAGALVDFLRRKGLTRIKAGDCSSNSALPTSKTAEKTGLLRALRGKADVVFFDRGSWVEVPAGGEFLKKVTVPAAAVRAGRIITLANMKTHRLADFSFGLKSAVGFMHPLERKLLHEEHLREKAVEINLAVPSDLIIIDGRRAFISGGPDRGVEAEAGVFLCGCNPLAVDVEAYRALYALKKEHSCIECFKDDPFEMGQLRHARSVGAGGRPWRGSRVLEL